MRSFLALLTLLVSAAASASNAAAAGAGHWSQLNQGAAFMPVEAVLKAPAGGHLAAKVL